MIYLSRTVVKGEGIPVPMPHTRTRHSSPRMMRGTSGSIW
jgi:hypothetical protein